jgi:hypothetical protein
MRNLIFTLLLLCGSAFGQGIIGNGLIQYVFSAPSGACSPNAQQQDVVGTGAIYTCQSGTWGQVSGGGGSVTGTANQITVTGSTLSIPSTFIAPGTISATTSIDATKLLGNLPALNGSALTNLPGGISGLTTGFLPKAASGTSLGNTLCDEGITTANTITCTDSAGIAAAGFTGTGSGAGFVQLGQGTAPTAGTTAVTLYAPASVTSYIFAVPGAAATGFLYGTNSSGTVTGSFIANPLPIANGGLNASSAVAGAVPNTSSTTAAAWTVTPTLGASGTAGTLATFPATGNFTTTWGSAATTSNTILGFVSAPTTAHIVTCTTSGTTCTLTDGGTTIAALAPLASPSFTTPALGVATGTSVTMTGVVSGATFASATNCSAAGSGANPSLVACSAAPAGAFSCSTTASTGTCTVSTTAVAAATSDIFVQPTGATAVGTRLSVTCNTTADTGLTAPRLATVAAGNFTINLGTFSSNPECFEYWVVN